jgi:RimJ/RimL family protein N-acetyltransferase
MAFPFGQEIVLENAFVLLRPMCEADLENLLMIATADHALVQFSPKLIYTKPLLEEYIESPLDNRSKGNRYPFTVIDKRQQAYAGSTSFLGISDAVDRLEIGGAWYGREFQRTGLNGNCKDLLLDYAFDALGAERVEFKTDERNLSSRKAIEKIGGQFEGILRRHILMHDGFRRNTCCYSILKSEWNEMKERFLTPTP